MIGDVLYSRKRKDRWWRFHTLKRAFLDAQTAVPGGVPERRALDRALKRLGYRTPPESVYSFWGELVALGCVRTSSFQRRDVERVETLANGLSPEMLPPACWLDLYRLCVGVGFFQLGKVLRDHGLASMVEQAGARDASLKDLTAAFYAEAERGSFGGAREWLREMSHHGCPDERIAQASWLVGLLAGDKNEAHFGFRDAASPEDLAFGRFIQGQHIAFVGPVPSTVAHGPEIDRHEVVVKFGYRGGDKGRDPDTQGERLDISYYNNTQAQLLSQSDFNGVFSSIRWAVCNNRKGRALFPADYSGLRQLTSFQWMLADTHFNAGPNAALDLLRFCPASVRVFNTDLMLSSGRFAGYTPEGAKPVDYTRSFIKTHDPIMQYQIMHRLWGVGYLTGDDRFEKVMNMGLRQYLDELQQAHGASERALF